MMDMDITTKHGHAVYAMRAETTRKIYAPINTRLV